MAIRDAHTSTDSQSKRGLLCSFKEAVSVQAPEFSDRQQKVSQLVLCFIISPPPDSFSSVYKLLCVFLCVQDAHEFLTSVLDQIRRLSPLMQQIARSMGRRYTCPVEDHLVFKMENTRTCKR